MSVSGELSAETNGVTTRISADGSLVRWDLVDATSALARRSASRREVARVSEMLRHTGVTVLIEESGKPLLELGQRRSLLGRALFGTPTVQPRSVFRLAALRWRLRSQRRFQ